MFNNKKSTLYIFKGPGFKEIWQYIQQQQQQQPSLLVPSKLG
jgi:hypothetical protein